MPRLLPLPLTLPQTPPILLPPRPLRSCYLRCLRRYVRHLRSCCHPRLSAATHDSVPPTSTAADFAAARMSALDLEPSQLVKEKASEISNELKGTSVFLVGINCSMKTDLGKLLADALRYYYFDSDSLVEQAVGGEAAAKSFKETDQKGYRDSETEVLKQLSSMGRLVVCTGDRAVESSANLALMRHGLSIWVDVPLDMLANELTESEAAQLVPQELSNLYYEMREGYGTADATISLQKVATQLGYADFSDVTAEDMALEAMKEIKRLTSVKRMMEAAARPF